MAKKKVVLNWGHFLNTAGKQTPIIPELGRRIKEYEFNRPTAELLRAELIRCGFDVVMVGSTTYDMPLAEIVRKANESLADIFVSIHFNAFDGMFDEPLKDDPDGTGIFYHTGSVNGQKLATLIGNYLQKGTPQKWRGVRPAEFYVIKYTKMPAVLSENGFMDDRREAGLMLDKAFQKEVAIEHAKGICDYFGVAYVPEPVVVIQPKPTEPPVAPETGSYSELSDWDKKVYDSVVKGGVMSDKAFMSDMDMRRLATVLYTAKQKGYFK